MKILIFFVLSIPLIAEVREFDRGEQTIVHENKGRHDSYVESKVSFAGLPQGVEAFEMDSPPPLKYYTWSFESPEDNGAPIKFEYVYNNERDLPRQMRGTKITLNGEPLEGDEKQLVLSIMFDRKEEVQGHPLTQNPRSMRTEFRELVALLIPMESHRRGRGGIDALGHLPPPRQSPCEKIFAIIFPEYRR